MLRSSRGSSFIGMGLETDESVPFGARWSGYRFQITIVYPMFLEATDTWEEARFDKLHPVAVKPVLCDICHVPTKAHWLLWIIQS